MSSEQKVAIITGASRGMGLAMAEALARRGRSLILVARQRDQLESIAIELTQRFGVEVLFRACDLGEPLRAARIDDLCTSDPAPRAINEPGAFGTIGKAADDSASYYMLGYYLDKNAAKDVVKVDDTLVACANDDFAWHREVRPQQARDQVDTSLFEIVPSVDTPPDPPPSFAGATSRPAAIRLKDSTSTPSSDASCRST